MEIFSRKLSKIDEFDERLKMLYTGLWLAYDILRLYIEWS